MRNLNDIKKDIALIGLEISKAKPAVDHYNHLLSMKSDLERELFLWKINNGEYHSITELPHEPGKMIETIELVIKDDTEHVDTRVLIDHTVLDEDGKLHYNLNDQHLYPDPVKFDPHDYIFEHRGFRHFIKVLGYLKVHYKGE